MTSGRPSQNVDIAGVSFPRRFGVRFHNTFLEKNRLVGLQVKWQAYEDDMFTKSLGKQFYHEDTVTREGWAYYYFQGIFQNEEAYVKLEIVNPTSGFLVKEMFFKFKKAYRTTLNGKNYYICPIKGKKMVKDGFLTELIRVEDEKGVQYVDGDTMFDSNKIVHLDEMPEVEQAKRKVIIRVMVRYCEEAKAMFMVTPPHAMKYAKLPLILLTQMVNLNFEKSYMTRSSQKPDAGTNFMLDELGNLQSEGKGIENFATLLSIGLGQDQRFSATCC